MNGRRAWQLAVRKCKRALEWSAAAIFDRLALLGVPVARNPKSAAIVHLELLGDAVIWLPYGRALVRHLLARGQAPLLIIDERLVALFEQALPGCPRFAVPVMAFVKSPMVRARILRRLRALGVAQTLHACCPRDGLLQDAVVRALGAPATGFDEVAIDRIAFDRWASRRLYRERIVATPGVHQNLRHAAFVQRLGVDVRSVQAPSWPDFGCAPLDVPYWVVAPGASRAHRRWPAARFAAVAQRVRTAYPHWRCVIIGTAAERPLAQTLLAALGDAGIDLCGQTDLAALLRWIAHARLVLGNDSAAGHIAASLGVPAVVVVGGGHYGRCYPYDGAAAPVRRLPEVVTRPLPCFGCDWVCEWTLRQDRPYPCVDTITATEVSERVLQVLAA